jgi:homoserine dehydrogenase
MQHFNIGLFGLGVVGQGFLSILEQTPDAQARVSKICVKHPGKPRPVSADRLTYNPDDLLDDPDINLIVETITEIEEAFHIVSKALERRKPVITVNKKMVAHHLPELMALQEKHQTHVLYEGAVCGSIPIMRTLDEHFGAEPLGAIEGIFNGTSNYILTRMQQDQLDFGTALQQAQDAGFAELDPSSDIDGDDAKYKLILLSLHSHGHASHPADVLNLGIRHLRTADLAYAHARGGRIKLLPCVRYASAGALVQYVLPALVLPADPLHHIDFEFNAVRMDAFFSGEQFYTGRGAGGFPTGSAIMSDLNALQSGFHYRFRKHQQNGHARSFTGYPLHVYMSMPATVPWQQAPLEETLSMEQQAGVQVLTGHTTVQRLLEAKGWLRAQEVFLMRL